VHWELIGSPVWATAYDQQTQDKMIRDGKVWGFDKIPSRIEQMKAWMQQPPPAGYDAVAYYTHCQGGCDRTGEFVASYRMNYYHTPLLKTIYDMNNNECGRAPDYFATGAIGWYCLTWNLYNATKAGPAVPDCLTAYKCQLFKGCQDTNK
jgi:hypothetical protein